MLNKDNNYLSASEKYRNDNPHINRIEGGLRVRGIHHKSEPDKPLISIVTIVHNGQKNIKQTMLSVLNQSYENIEYIIIDGGSSDSTLDIIRAYEDRITYWLSEPDKGISDAFNKGFDLTTGEIITFLNSDDYYPDTEVITRVIEEFKQSTSVNILYGKACLVHPETEKTLVIKGREFDLKKLERYMTIPHQSVFARREVYKTTGSFDLKYKIAMDYDFFFRALKLYSPYYMDDVIAIMRVGGKSDKEMFKAFGEFYEIQRKYGIGFLRALENIIINYTKSSARLFFEGIGLYSIVKLYRKMTGQL